jgi:pimeloyl-ACP methyl ester carboxylesterase
VRRDMETIEIEGADGIRLVADVDGDPTGPPVLLLHGGGQTRHAWGTTQRVLAERGCNAWSADLRGHGDSQWAPDGDYSIDGFAGDVRAIAASFDRPPALVGASLGGLSSMVAIGESEPGRVASALVLVDVGHRIESEGVERIGDFMTSHLDGFATLDDAADAIAAYNPHRPRPKDLSGLAKNLRRRADGRWAWHWDPRFVSGRWGTPDETRSSVTDPDRLEAAARALTLPVLLVRGRMSDLLSEEGAQAFLDVAPHARFVDVAGAGHMVAGDKNDLFNAAVVDFLATVT